MNLVEDFYEYWGTIFQARQQGPRHFYNEEFFRFVQQAPDDINWTLNQAEFDDLVASKKDSAGGPDGILHGIYRCAGVRSSSFMLIMSFWREGIFLIVGQSLTLKLLIRMTLEGLFDHLMHFGHLQCAIAIANSLILPFNEAFIGTLCDVCTPLRDASVHGK